MKLKYFARNPFSLSLSLSLVPSPPLPISPTLPPISPTPFTSVYTYILFQIYNHIFS